MFDRAGTRRARLTKRRLVPTVDRLEPLQLATVGTITVAAKPNILFPANNQFVTVAVTGTIVDTQPAGPTSAFFQVTDEYRRIEPRGKLTPVKVGTNLYAFAFTVKLQASHSFNIDNGRRHYSVLVAAGDQDNGNGTTIAVHVPRNLQDALTPPKPQPVFHGKVSIPVSSTKKKFLGLI